MTIDRERLRWLSMMIRIMRMLEQDHEVIAYAGDDDSRRVFATMIGQVQALHDELLAALPAEDEQSIPY